MVEDNVPFEATTREADAIDREMLIKMLSDIGNKLYLRISAQRFRERATDDTLLKFVRAWSGVMVALNTSLRDSDMIELEQRIAALEQPEKTKEICYE